jgi:four helix bundle protein
MDLNELHVYKRAMAVAEAIWSEVDGWDYFARDTVGKQLVRAADSIGANISEGHGRFHYGENRQFCYYARGSLQETLTWLNKAHYRNLLDAVRYQVLRDDLITVRRMLNGYIRSIGRTS